MCSNVQQLAADRFHQLTRRLKAIDRIVDEGLQRFLREVFR
jgi:hypothetical protein